MQKRKRKMHFQQVRLADIQPSVVARSGAKKKAGSRGNIEVERPERKTEPYSMRHLADGNRR